MADLPNPEIIFYPRDNQILVQKCDPNQVSTATDPECNTGLVYPYFKKYTVVIIGTLNDYSLTSSRVEFDVTIGPNCDPDAVKFSANVASQFSGVYTLGINQSYPLKLDPSLTQNVPNCPVTCQLTSINPFDPIS